MDNKHGENPALHDEAMFEHNEAWHDDLAHHEKPEDGFADPQVFDDAGSYHEHGDHLHDDEAHISATEESEEVVEDEGETEAEGEVAAPQKNNNWILYVAGGVAALFVGGMMYLQFSGSGNGGGSAAVPVAAALKQETATKTPSAPISPTTAAAVSPPLDMNAIYGGSGQAAGAAKPPSSTPAAPSELTSASSEIITDMAPAPSVPAPNMPIQTSKSQPIDQRAIVAASANQVKATNPPATPTMAPTPAAPDLTSPAVLQVEQQMKDLQARLDMMQKSLEQTTQKLGQVSANLNTPQPVAPAQVVAAETSPEVTQRMERLEQQLAQMNQAMANIQAAKAAPKQVPPTTNDSFESKPEAEIERPVAAAANFSSTKHQAVTHHHKTKHHTKVAKKSSRHHGKATQTASESSARWVLRAATPDRAYISKGYGSSELQAVEVGQSISGIGKVKSIKQLGDGWVVVGSKATLR